MHSSGLCHSWCLNHGAQLREKGLISPLIALVEGREVSCHALQRTRSWLQWNTNNQQRAEQISFCWRSLTEPHESVLPSTAAADILLAKCRTREIGTHSPCWPALRTPALAENTSESAPLRSHPSSSFPCLFKSTALQKLSFPPPPAVLFLPSPFPQRLAGWAGGFCQDLPWHGGGWEEGAGGGSLSSLPAAAI